MAGYKNKQGRKPKASTIVDRQRDQENGVETKRMPSAPAHLIGEARREWSRVGKQLRDAGLLTNLDTAALAAYCVAHARYLEAEELLQGAAGLLPKLRPPGP